MRWLVHSSRNNFRDSNAPDPKVDGIHVSYLWQCLLDSGTATPPHIGRGGSAAPDAGAQRPTGSRRRFAGLETVAEQVHSRRYNAVPETSTFGGSGRRPHQLAWDLEGAEVELVVGPVNSLSSGIG